MFIMPNVLSSKPRELFISTILQHSSNKEDYGKALKEWREVMAGPMPDDSYTTCICGQRIIRTSIIFNLKTYQTLTIGFNCRDKYIADIDSVSVNFVNRLYSRNVINDWEYGFLRNLSKLTGKYSVKQKAVYLRISNKVVSFLKSLLV